VAGSYEKEEQVQEAFGDPQAPSFEETNPEAQQGKAWFISTAY
jgi:hypothetical protein